MSIWSSLSLPDGREPRAGSPDQCDEYGDYNPRDHVIDVAVAFKQVRLCIWPEGRFTRGETGEEAQVLLLPDDLIAVRDLLNLAIEQHQRAAASKSGADRG